MNHLIVIPAKAGTQLPSTLDRPCLRHSWVPAFAGMTKENG